MTEPAKVDLKSMSITDDQKAKLRQLFPQVFNEDRIDFDKLRRTLGEDIDEGEERFGMTWPGKNDCFKVIQTPSVATLKPAKEESVDWGSTENLFIEGDNLEVLKLLQRSYYGKVKMIYIDPPYNTGKQFIYPDKYSESLETYLAYTGQIDDQGQKFSTNTEAEGRFHSKWINMMYPRLFLARNLLREDGMIFISISDKEVDNLRKLCNEIFGEECFVAQFIWNTEGHTDNQYDVKINHEYILLYAKNSKTSLGYIIDPNTREESNLWKGYAENSITKNGSGNPPSEVILPVGFPVKVDNINLESNKPPEKFFEQVKKAGYITRQITKTFNVSYPIRIDNMAAKSGGLTKACRVYSGWANVNKLQRFIDQNCTPIIEDNGDSLGFYLSENGVIYYRREREQARNILSVLRNMGTTEQMRSELERLGIPFQYPKPKELLKYLIKIGLDDKDVILDFFAGSGTTAHAAYELNVSELHNIKCISIQLPELIDTNDKDQKESYDFCVSNSLGPNIANLCKERIRRVIKKIEDEESAKAKESRESLPGMTEEQAELDLGFRVFKLDKSNFNIWDGTVDENGDVSDQIGLFVEHIDPDSRDEDILYEILLKSGFELTTKIEELDMAGKKVYSIADNALLICLDRKLTKEVITEMARLQPARVVCLDAGFTDNDQLKTNAVQIMKSHDVEDFRTV